MPIPKAFVATITWILPDFHYKYHSRLEKASISPWYPTNWIPFSDSELTIGPMSAMKSVYTMAAEDPTISEALAPNCIAGGTDLSDVNSSTLM